MILSLIGLTPPARAVFSAYFAPSPPLWTGSRLLRDDDRARGVAEKLGLARAIVLRGNGAITVGRTLPEALTLAWMLDQSGRHELSLAMSAATANATLLTPAEAADLSRFEGREVERLWEYLTSDDAESHNAEFVFYADHCQT